MRNRKLEEELRRLKNENDAIIEEYKGEIEKLETEQEGLRFSSDLLDQSNRELELEISQRQKQGRKRMSGKQLWDSIYQNFLYMLQQYRDSSLPKQRVLEFLETPLPPLNLNIENFAAENEIMTQLLVEYRKFYGEQSEELEGEEILPYDVLNAKNKFFYLVAESLLSQGIGSPSEVDQLKAGLEALIQKNG